jgi:hypothetical protein
MAGLGFSFANPFPGPPTLDPQSDDARRRNILAAQGMPPNPYAGFGLVGDALAAIRSWLPTAAPAPAQATELAPGSLTALEVMPSAIPPPTRPEPARYDPRLAAISEASRAAGMPTHLGLAPHATGREQWGGESTTPPTLLERLGMLGSWMGNVAPFGGPLTSPQSAAAMAGSLEELGSELGALRGPKIRPTTRMMNRYYKLGLEAGGADWYVGSRKSSDPRTWRKPRA